MNKEKWVAGIWAMIEQYEGNLKDKDTAYMEVSKTIVNKIDAEVRKLLEDKIDLLENDILNYKADIENLKDSNFGVLRIKPLEEEIERLKSALKTASNINIASHKVNAVKQERQKVIAELEEWAETESYRYSIKAMKYNDIDLWLVGRNKQITDLKQKLNEMKEV